MKLELCTSVKYSCLISGGLIWCSKENKEKEHKAWISGGFTNGILLCLGSKTFFSDGYPCPFFDINQWRIVLTSFPLAILPLASCWHSCSVFLASSGGTSWLLECLSGYFLHMTTLAWWSGEQFLQCSSQQIFYNSLLHATQWLLQNFLINTQHTTQYNIPYSMNKVQSGTFHCLIFGQ